MMSVKKHRAIPTLMTLCLVVACAPAKKNKWEDIDYSRVYKAYENRQNDAGYTPPAATNSCMDDDFCN